jgi:hypothetical protein
LLTILLVLSDRLTLLQVIVPLIVTTLLFRREVGVRTTLISTLPLLIGSFVGYALYLLVIPNPIRNPAGVGVMFPNIQFDTDSNWYFSFVVLVLVMAVMALATRLSRKTNSSACLDKSEYFRVFVALSILVTVFVLSLKQDGVIRARYMGNVFYFSLIIGVSVLSKNLIWSRFLVIPSVVLLMILGSLKGYENYTLNGFSSEFYPSDIKCLDEGMVGSGVSMGVAQYWDARYIESFSKRQLEIAQYGYNDSTKMLVKKEWITKRSLFKDRYDFAVVGVRQKVGDFDRSPRDLILAVNGPPSNFYMCGKYEIYEYPDEQGVRVGERLRE